MDLHLFGLTGGIACGKTTVAGFLRDRGVPVIDADQVARDVVAAGSPALHEIASRFGAEVLSVDGSLDRKKLGAIVFADAEARRTLEAITHPRIRDRATELATALAREGHTLAAYEAALLIESSLQDRFRPLVVVTVDSETQVARVMARDGFSREQAVARLDAQMPLSEKVLLADHVIDTSMDLASVRARTHDVLVAIRAELKLVPLEA
jgi:dephospho-CoA kinase